MEQNKKLMRFNELYCDLYKQQNEIIAKEWESKNPNVDGILEVTFKHKGISVLIHINEDSPSIKRIEIDNELLWEYVVNEAYKSSKKSIYFSRYNSVNYLQISLNEETIKEIDTMWHSNEEFCQLSGELMLKGSKHLTWYFMNCGKTQPRMDTLMEEIEKVYPKENLSTEKD